MPARPQRILGTKIGVAEVPEFHVEKIKEAKDQAGWPSVLKALTGSGLSLGEAL